PLLIQGEEAPNHGACAVRTAAIALPLVVTKRVQAIVDGYLLASADIFPCVDIHAVPHGVRIAGVIEVAAWWQQHGAGLPVKLAEMHLVRLRERGNITIGD